MCHLLHFQAYMKCISEASHKILRTFNPPTENIWSALEYHHSFTAASERQMDANFNILYILERLKYRIFL